MPISMRSGRMGRMLPSEWKNSFACGASWWMRANSVCQARLEDPPEHARGNQLRRLRGVVVGLAHDIDEVAEAGQGHLPKPQFQLDHRVEDRAGQLLVGGEVDHQPLHAAHALGHLEDAGEHALDHHGAALVAIRLRERAEALDALGVAGVGPRVGAHVGRRQVRPVQRRLHDREVEAVLFWLMLRHAPFVEEPPVLARVDDVDLPVVAVQRE